MWIDILGSQNSGFWKPESYYFLKAWIVRIPVKTRVDWHFGDPDKHGFQAPLFFDPRVSFHRCFHRDSDDSGFQKVMRFRLSKTIVLGPQDVIPHVFSQGFWRFKAFKSHGTFTCFSLLKKLCSRSRTLLARVFTRKTRSGIIAALQSLGFKKPKMSFHTCFHTENVIRSCRNCYFPSS